MQMLSTLDRATFAAAGTLVALTLTGCATESPAGHSLRLEKAAGLKMFHIETTEALWRKTSEQGKLVPDEQKIVAKVHKLGDGLVRVELTGVSLVNYLRVLDRDAHGGLGDAPFTRSRESESIRMYDEIAKELDAVTERPAPGAPPLKIVVADAFVEKDAKNG